MCSWKWCSTENTLQNTYTLSQTDQFHCNTSWCIWTFCKLTSADCWLSPCICVCERKSECYSTELDKPECPRCPHWGRFLPEWPSSPPDWRWTRICWRRATCLVLPVPGWALGEAPERGPRTSLASPWTDLVEGNVAESVGLEVRWKQIPRC